MKKRYDPKITFLSTTPKLLQYIKDVDFSLREVISIEIDRAGPVHRYIFKGMGFAFMVETDSEFSFFKNKLKLSEIVADL